jgi:DNA-binding beta-propeller fold protein YncE
MEMNVLPSGLVTGMPDGPRYFAFHPNFNVAYVVNELSSTVAVFEVDRRLLGEIAAASANGEDMCRFQGRSTLRLVQSIKTLPAAFPTTLNTCGRMCVHKSGRFVVVSNRGHQSIAVFKVHQKGAHRGELTSVGYYHTRGETPRHFQFDASGQYLLVANQDTDSLAVFTFNLSSGDIKYTGNEYCVPSPNFVCNCPIYEDDEDGVEPTSASITWVDTERHNVATSSDSEVSVTTEPVKEGPTHSFEDELASARLEIAQLKDQLALLTTTEGGVESKTAE